LAIAFRRLIVSCKGCALFDIPNEIKLPGTFHFFVGAVRWSEEPNLARIEEGPENLPTRVIARLTSFSIANCDLASTGDFAPKLEALFKGRDVGSEIVVNALEISDTPRGIVACAIPVRCLYADENAQDEDNQIDCDRCPILLP